MKRSLQLLSIATLLGSLASVAVAQEMWIHPTLASFGGRPLPESLALMSLPAVGIDPVGGSSSLESTPIQSAQIKVRTADHDDAGQYDGVLVRLNGANETWLDSGADDFERGKTCTFDLLQVNANGAVVLTKLSDIQFLEISKTGSDGWCFSELELIVNGRTIYKANYPRGQWLDNSGGARLMHKITGATLRSGSLWAGGNL